MGVEPRRRALPSGFLEAGAEPADAGRQLYAVSVRCATERRCAEHSRPGRLGSWERVDETLRPLQPGSFDPKELDSAVAKRTENVRIYEKRSAMKLPDDIKSSTSLR